MDARIGTLAVRYCVDGTDGLVAARLPALTRALQRDLADALDSRLTATLGDGREVYVIRELHADTTVSTGSLTLDAAIVDHISRVYADSLSRLLARPNDDVVKFDDTAGFVTAFIIDELNGCASEKWYFGAFDKFRAGDSRRTLEAVLQAYPTHVAVVLGRLAQRRYLDTFLALIGASRALGLAEGGDVGTSHAGDAVVLVEIAFDIAARLGWPIDRRLRAVIRQALLLDLGAMRPDWSDRRQLTEFVWDCVEAAVDMMEARGQSRGPFDPVAFEEFLRGPLDWLDHAWITARIEGDAEPFAVGVPAARAADALRLVLDRVERAVAEGRVAVRGDFEVDQIVARFIAAAELDAGEAAMIAPLRRVLTDAVTHWRRQTTESGASAGTGSATDKTGASALLGHEPAARRARPVESTLVDALERLSADRDARGMPTSGGGLYLMTRAVLDVGLPGLASVHEVPLPALLAGIAVGWLGLERPFDRPARVWTGAGDGDETSPEAVGARLANLLKLEGALRQRLQGLQVAVPAIDTAMRPQTDDDMASVAACLDRLGGLLLAAWARWLRGLETSSPRFLVDRCLRRRGTALIRDSSVTIALEPAPLDVVLRMAGYFQPIEAVPWLGGRSVAFNVTRSVS